MKTDSKVVLLAHARTGSTSLMRALDAHPDIHMCHEPFHPSHSNWYPGAENYIDRIHDEESLERELFQIFQKYNAIKTLTYQLSEKLYEHLLLRDDVVVIFLTRRNILRAAVSVFVARQTNVWQKSDIQKNRAPEEFQLDPIPISELRETVEYVRELNSVYQGVLLRRPPSSVLKIQYEDLFSGSLEKNRGVLASIFEFLELVSPDGDTIDKLLDPRFSKIMTDAMYRSIPNALEIEEALGCEELGWILREER